MHACAPLPGAVRAAVLFAVLAAPAAAGGARAETPAATLAPAAPVESPHCFAGCPVGAPASNRLLRRECYVLSNNGRTKFADWVAYALVPARFGGGDRPRWRADPDLPADETLEPADYKGAHKALKVDRGHQAPFASCAATKELRRQTGYLSNATPQGSALNRGAWRALETAARRLAKAAGSAVHVVTGPLHERETRPLPGADEPHRVPSGYWKLVVAAGPGGTAAAAFAMESDRPAGVPFRAARIGLDELERRTGLRFFPALAPAARAALEAAAPALAARLGAAR